MIYQICKACGTDLPADTGFYANDKTCKECRKERVRANRRAKIQYYREYDRKRANREDRVAARKAYAKTEQGIEKGNAAKNRWTEKNKKKRWVAYAVNNAVRDGVLKKPSECSSCGKTNCRIEGHHSDYDRPLDVQWLCSACHRAWHKMNGPGANA